jgi:adenylate cyclase
VRVTVQLIEAETGAHLWAEKYDRKLVDIFDLQDELTSAIVGTLPGRLRASEEDRIQRKPPSDMAAFDYLLAGKVHHHRATKEDNAAAIELLDMAIALDPRFAQAYAWQTCTLGQAMEYGFCDNAKETLDEAIKTLHKALALDENDVECHRLLCEVNLDLHQLETAKVHADRALLLNPNDPRIVAQQGEILTWQSRSNEAIEWLEKSFRLDPLNTNERAHLLGRALYACRRYDEAIEAFKQKTKPRRGHLAELASCYAQAGMAARAEQQAAAELRLWPDFSIGEYIRTLPFVEPADRDHLAEGLHHQRLGLRLWQSFFRRRYRHNRSNGRHE